MHSVVTATTAPPGEGKTFARCGRGIWYFLKEEEGVHYSNFPVRFDPWTETSQDGTISQSGQGLVLLASEKLKLSPDEVRRRVQTIPKTELLKWEQDSEWEGPWKYFADVDLQGAHIAFDEAHHYWPARPTPAQKAKVERLIRWVSEIRHRGCTLEFLTQDMDNLPDGLKKLCNERIIVTNIKREQDPLFKISLDDYAQLVAGLTGFYRSYIREDHWVHNGKSKTRINSESYALDPFYFSLYDSYSRPALGGKKATARREPWQRFRGWKIIPWFAWKNLGKLWWRIILATVFLWLTFGGGINYITTEVIRRSAAHAKIAAVKKPEVKPNDFHEEKTLPADKAGKTPAAKPTADQIALAKAEQRAGQLAHELAEMKQAKKDLEGKLSTEDWICCICGDNVIMKTGDWYHVGDCILWGPYQGQKITSVEWKNRCVCLSNGVRLHLGGLLAPDATKRKAELPGNLQPTPASGPTGSTSPATTGNGPNPQRPESTSSPLRTFPSGARPSFNSPSPGPGQ